MKTDAKQYTEPDTSKFELASGLLHRLCKHADTKVRLHLAENRHTPIELLIVLSYDSSPAVRLAVAENASSQLCLIERAIDDVSVDVRYGLAENPHLPTHLLEKLADDENPYVACRAERTLARVLRECIALQCSKNSCLSS
ncbi:MAG: hypothetical protein WCT03_05745 [Candidatus Obscuribacterales bacterium]|jgi:hypothetical protein